MASGKTSIGWILARLAGLGWLDADREVERRCGKSIARIFAEDGEGRFRAMERGVVSDWAGVRQHVLSVGGGAVMDDESWGHLRKMGTLVWLRPPTELVARRLLARPELMLQRPLIADLAPPTGKDSLAEDLIAKEERFTKLVERLDGIIQQRSERYGTATVVFESGWETPETSAKLLLSMLRAEKVPAVVRSRGNE
jgi:shikimate kinase